MKKFLTSLLALLSCCTMLTACSFFGKDKTSDSTPDTSAPSSSVPETSDPADEDPHAAALNAAKTFIHGEIVEKDTAVRADYKLRKSFYSPILDEMLSISWTVDVTSGIVLVEGEEEWTADVDELLDEDLFYKLTCTISDSDGHTTTFTLDRMVKKAPPFVPQKITKAPVEGTAYKLYMYQAKKYTDLYFKGEMSNFFLATTTAGKEEAYNDAVDVLAEKVEGKDAYYLTFTDSKGVKQYLGFRNVWSEGSYHDNAIYAPSPVVAEGKVETFEFTWSETYKTMIATLDGVKTGSVQDTTETKSVTFFYGTSGNYYTFDALTIEEFDDSYAGYLVTIVDRKGVTADVKVATEKESLNITTAYSGAVSEKLPTRGSTYADIAISWALKSGDATVENNVLTVAAPTEDKTIVLTATITCGTVSDTKDVTITVYPKSPVTAVTEPVEGTAYTVYMYHTTKAKNYYFTGKMSSDYLGTTDNAAKAADTYIENVENGFKIYVLNADNSKSYLTLEAYQKPDKSYLSAKLSLTAEGSVFTFNKQFSTLCCVDDYEGKSDTFFLGTYGDFTTISASGSYYMTADKLGTEQFYATFGIIDETALPPVEDEPEAPVLTTPEQILNALYALESSESLEGPFTLTGKITALDSYKNPTFVVEGFEAKPVYCFRLVLENAKVGDTITVTAGSMKNHNGLYEFMDCTLDSLVAGGGEITPPEGGEEEQPLTTTPIATIIASELGKFQAEGTVIAVTASSFLIKDSSKASMLVYTGSAPTVALGNVVTVAGTTATYGGAKQFAKDATITVKEQGSAPFAGMATGLDGAACDALLSAAVVVKYVSVTGTLTIDGKYYNVAVEGATTATASISYPTNEMKDILAELDGEEIVVEGYFIGVTSGKYVQIIALSVRAADDFGDDKEEEKPGEEECKEHNYIDGVCEFCGAADPDYKPEEEKPAEPAVLEIVEVADLVANYADNTYSEEKYSICGRVVLIEDATRGVMYIADEKGNKLYVYCTYDAEGELAYGEMKGAPVVGDTVELLTVVGKYYNNVIQAKNAWIVDVIPATAEEMIAVEKEALTVETSVLGAKEIELPAEGLVRPEVAIAWEVTAGNEIATISEGKLVITNPTADTKVTLVAILTVNETEADDSKTFEITVTPLSENVQLVKASKTIADLIKSEGWTNATTGQTFKLDDNVTVKVAGGQHTGKAYTDHIRIYSTDSPAGTLTISVPTGCSLVSVKISTVTGTYALLCIGTNKTDISNIKTEVSGSSVVITSVRDGDGKQARVTAIEVEYQKA